MIIFLWCFSPFFVVTLEKLDPIMYIVDILNLFIEE